MALLTSVINDSALLILDMQNDIAGGHKASDENSSDIVRITRNIARLRDSYHRASLPVIFTRVAYRNSYVDAHVAAPARDRSTLKEGDLGAEIIKELEPDSDDIIVVKKRIGAFYQTDLGLILRGLGKKNLMVTGTSLPRAVESTVREAHSRDIDCVVVSDASYASSKEEHSHCLEILSKYRFATVANCEDVLSAMRGE